MGFPRFTMGGSWLRPAAYQLRNRYCDSYRQAATISAESSRARSPAIYRSCNRLSSISSSISRPQKRSASKFPRRARPRRRGDRMKRREFITLLGGAASAWPITASAQQGQRVRLICILEGISADTPGAKTRYAAFLEGLQQLGWTPGRNVRIEVRYAEGDEAAYESMQRNSLRLLRTCLWSGGRRPRRGGAESRPAPFPSCLSSFPTRGAWLRRDRVAAGCHRHRLYACLHTTYAERGWNC